MFLFQSHKGNNFIFQSSARTLIAVVGVTICLVVLIKWYFGGGVCKSKARLDGKIHHNMLSDTSKSNVQNMKYNLKVLLPKVIQSSFHPGFRSFK